MKLKKVKPKGKWKGQDTSALLSAKLSMRAEADFISLLESYDRRQYASLVPLSLEGKRSSVVVLYDTKSLVWIPTCLSMPTAADQFVALLESLNKSFDQVELLNVPIDYLALEIDKLYLNSVAGTMSFLLYSYDREKRPVDPAFDMYRALGTDAAPATYDDRVFLQRYVEGLDKVKGQGLAGYRWYAASFVDEHRGKLTVSETPRRSPSQQFSREMLYDAELAAVSAEVLYERENDPRTLLRNDSFEGFTLVTPEGRARSVTLLPCIVGSSSDVDLRIDSGWVSRHHARFVLDGDVLLLEDLDSTNGTTVNGAKLQVGEPVAICDGDIVEFADRKFVVVR